MTAKRRLRREFFRECARGIGIIWPVLSALLVFMGILGFFVGRLEGWRVADGLYFAFVTGLTIGYGDLVPKHMLARLLALVIGMIGIVLTGLVVAVSVNALQRARNSDDAP